MRHQSRISLLTVIFCVLPALSFAAGTLDQIKKSGEIRIGYRVDAAPMASNDDAGKPTGYSVDLCTRIAAAVKETLKLGDLKITFVPLTSDDRIEAVLKNKVDIECGATTMTLERQEKVDFTAMTFVTGGTLLSLADSGVNTLGDVAGKSIAVVEGTTTEAALKAYLEKNLIDAKVVPLSDREAAMKRLDAKQVDAFASDQVVLIGQIIESGDPRRYSLSHDLFSFEPYAFVVRRNDADFRLVCNRALAQIYRSGQIEQLYMKWFGRAGIRSSPILKAMFALHSTPQ